MTTTSKLSTTTPTDLSTDFTEWLLKEKQEARRYRMGLVKYTAFLVICGAAFLLKDQFNNLLEFFEQAAVIVQP